MCGAFLTSQTVRARDSQEQLRWRPLASLRVRLSPQKCPLEDAICRRIKIPQEVPKHGISAINNTFFLCMAAHQTPSLEFRGFARERGRRSLSLKLVEIFTSPMNTNTAFEHKIPIKKALGRFLSRMLCHQSYVVTLPGASHPTGSALHQLIFCSLFHELIHGHLFLLCCSSHTSVKVRIKPQQHLS